MKWVCTIMHTDVRALVERSGNIQCTFRERSVHNQGTFTAQSGNIQCTIREHSRSTIRVRYVRGQWKHGCGVTSLCESDPKRIVVCHSLIPLVYCTSDSRSFAACRQLYREVRQYNVDQSHAAAEGLDNSNGSCKHPSVK